MTRQDHKKKLIKDFEFKVKLMQLRMKYCTNPFAGVIFAMEAVIETIKLKKELLKPFPTHERGISIINIDEKRT